MLFAFHSTPNISSVWIPSTFVPFPRFCLQHKNHGLFNRRSRCPQCQFLCLGVGVLDAERTEAKTSISQSAHLVERVTRITAAPQ